MPVFSENVLFEGTGVDTDADGSFPVTGGLDDLPYLPGSTDVPRVETHGVSPCGKGTDSEPVVKMDIRHEGKPHILAQGL